MHIWKLIIVLSWQTAYHISNVPLINEINEKFNITSTMSHDLCLTSTRFFFNLGILLKISKSSWYQGYRIKYLKSIYLNRCILLISFWVSFSADMRTFMDLFVATYQFFPTNNCNHSCMPWYQNMLQWLSCPTKILRIWKERKLKSQSHDAPTDILRNGGM